MKSKTSYFNKVIYEKDIKSCWPVWAMELVLATLFCWGYTALQINAANHLTVEEAAVSSWQFHPLVQKRQAIIDVTNILTSPLLIAGLSIILAVLVFKYMSYKRSAYMMHAFPIKREALYVSHFLSGLTMILVPMLISYLGIILLEMTNHLGITRLVFICLAESIIELCFFFALSCVVMTVSGNGIMGLVIYGVINVLYIFVYFMKTGAEALFVPGLSDQSFTNGFLGRPLGMLSPITYFMEIVGISSGEGDYKELKTFLYGMLDKSLPKCLWFILFAAILFYLGLLLYKNRQTETVGDSLSYAWCGSVFRVVFSFCAGCLFTVLLLIIYEIWFATDFVFNYNQYFFFVLLDMLIGVVLAYFISEMILQKRFLVFKTSHLKQMAVMLGCVTVVLIFLKSGAFVSRIPDAKNLAYTSIYISGYGNSTYFYDEPELMEEVKKLESGEIRNHAKDFPINGYNEDETVYVRFKYTGKDGQYYQRSYNLPLKYALTVGKYVTKDREQTVTSLFGKDLDEINWEGMMISCYRINGQDYWSLESGYDSRKDDTTWKRTIIDAFIRDIKAGVLAEKYQDETNCIENMSGNGLQSEDEMMLEMMLDISFDSSWYESEDFESDSDRYYSFRIDKDWTNVCAALEEVRQQQGQGKSDTTSK